MDDRQRVSLESAIADTRASFENRALLYAAIFDELEAEFGAERAAELMKRGIRRRGVEISARYADAAQAGDLDEVARLFIEGSPLGGALFEPFVAEEPANGRIVLGMTACPLVVAWREAGLSPERVDLLCDVASAVDFGTFEGVGFALRFQERQACEGCDTCLLEITIPG